MIDALDCHDITAVQLPDIPLPHASIFFPRGRRVNPRLE
jgi:hypothetical protein